MWFLLSWQQFRKWAALTLQLGNKHSSLWKAPPNSVSLLSPFSWSSTSVLILVLAQSFPSGPSRVGPWSCIPPQHQYRVVSGLPWTSISSGEERGSWHLVFWTKERLQALSNWEEELSFSRFTVYVTSSAESTLHTESISPGKWKMLVQRISLPGNL